VGTWVIRLGHRWGADAERSRRRSRNHSSLKPLKRGWFDRSIFFFIAMTYGFDIEKTEGNLSMADGFELERHGLSSGFLRFILA
jgi:hypothetical protein